MVQATAVMDKDRLLSRNFQVVSWQIKPRITIYSGKELKAEIWTNIHLPLFTAAFVLERHPPNCKSQGGEREREKQSNKCPEAEKKERERPHLGDAYLVLGFNLYTQRYILREHEVFLFLGEKKKNPTFTIVTMPVSLKL